MTFAASMAVRRRDEALHELGYSPQIFARERYSTNRETYSKQRATVAARRAVWIHMRRPDRGVQLSFPDIAAATGTSHSTVLEAVKRGSNA